MKIKAIIVSLLMAAILLAGCSTKAPAENTDAAQPAEAKETAQPAEAKADVVTTASIVKDADAFVKAAGKDGTWIIATLNDLTIDQDIVLEGAFTNKDLPARKIALYTQDDKHNVTARFSLTAPKLTIKSENARIQGGTFKGDVYVEAKGFSVVDAKVDGNVYFTSEEAQSTFKLDKGGSVTGATELKK